VKTQGKVDKMRTIKSEDCAGGIGIPRARHGRAGRHDSLQAPPPSSLSGPGKPGLPEENRVFTFIFKFTLNQSPVIHNCKFKKYKSMLLVIIEAQKYKTTKNKQKHLIHN
jgi:hypothetical protein